MISPLNVVMRYRQPSVLATSSTEASPIPSSPAAKPKKEMNSTVIFASSGIGGILGWAIVHPCNTVAIRMNLTPKGQTFSFSKMIAEQGALSLYDGLVAGMLRQVFYATSRFGLFETFRDMLHQYRGKTDFASRVGIGALTGGMAAYISCPMEVCVVRMSNDSSLPVNERQNYKSVVDVATRIVKNDGFFAFWRGSQPFVARAMMVGVFQVAFLDQFKELYVHYFNQKKDSIPNVFCSAMSAGLIYSLATMPLEACKNRMASQRKDAAGKLPYRSIVQTLTKVSTEEGFLALYNGFFPYYLRCGGHTVAMFIIVQMTRDLYMAM